MLIGRIGRACRILMMYPVRSKATNESFIATRWCDLSGCVRVQLTPHPCATLGNPLVNADDLRPTAVVVLFAV